MKMSKEEKIDKIIEMTKEICYLIKDHISDSAFDKLFLDTRLMLETYSQLYGKESESNEEN